VLNQGPSFNKKSLTKLNVREFHLIQPKSFPTRRKFTRSHFSINLHFSRHQTPFRNNVQSWLTKPTKDSPQDIPRTTRERRNEKQPLQTHLLKTEEDLASTRKRTKSTKNAPSISNTENKEKFRPITKRKSTEAIPKPTKKPAKSTTPNDAKKK
jgi:hypothetical protein